MRNCLIALSFQLFEPYLMRCVWFIFAVLPSAVPRSVPPLPSVTLTVSIAVASVTLL